MGVPAAAPPWALWVGGGRPALARLALALLTATVGAAAAAEDASGDRPFTVVYRCEGGRLLAVAYPAFREARTEPARLSWQDATRLLYPAPSGSGARYVSRRDDLVWWNKGRSGFLERASDGASLLAGCVQT